MKGFNTQLFHFIIHFIEGCGDRGHHPGHGGRADRAGDQQGAVRAAAGRGEQEQDLQVRHLQQEVHQH